MPAGSIIVAIVIFAMFTAFAAMVIWADLQTRTKQSAQRANAKRRAF